MSILRRALAAAGYRVKQTPRRTTASALPEWFTAGDLDLETHKTDVQAFRAYAEKYARSPTDYMAVSKITEAIGMAGIENLRVFPEHQRWEDVDPIDDHVLYQLLRAPNPTLTQFEFFEAVGGWQAVAGNAYIYIHPDMANQPASLWILPSYQVTPKVDKAEGLVGYTYEVNNKKFVLDAGDVMHVRRWNPLDDYTGLAPSEAAAYALAIDMSMQKYGLAWFRNGASPSAVIESERDEVDTNQLRLMEREFERDHTGSPEKMRKPYWLWSGFKLKEFSKGPRDSDFVEGRKMNRLDVWGVRGVHPGLLTSENVNKANAQVAEYLFAKYTVLPVLVRIAGQFNKDLMPRYGDGNVVRFIDVVPRDTVQDAQVQREESVAVVNLVKSLGPVEGVKEAQRKGLLSMDVDMESLAMLPASQTDTGPDDASETASEDEASQSEGAAEQEVPMAEMADAEGRE